MISIVIATYNAELHLEETLQSIVNQTWKDKEIVVIDGKSNDSTLSIIEKYKSDIAYWISEPDKGVYDAWNKALKAVRGDWICFIGADDFFYSSRVLEKIAPNLKIADDEEIDFVYGVVKYITDSTGKLIKYFGEDWSKISKRIKNNMCIMHSGSFHSKRLFTRYGNFDSSFSIAGDYDFLLRKFKNENNKALFLSNLTILTMREGGLSGRFDNKMSLINELMRARQNNGLSNFSFELFLMSIDANLRRFLRKTLGKSFFLKIISLLRELKNAR